ncbi:MAG TPA: metallophosphoesterase [Polyangiaceae bacterium]|jgi:hypothetical protein
MRFWLPIALAAGVALVYAYRRAANAGFARKARWGAAALAAAAFWAFIFWAFSRAQGAREGAHVATVTTSLLAILIAIPVILYRWLADVLPLRRRRFWLLASTAGLLVLAMAGSAAIRRPDVSAGAVTLYVAVSLILWAFAVSAVPIGVLRAVVALVARRRQPAPRSAEVRAPDLTRRQVVEGLGGAAILTWTGGAFAWGAARGRFDVQLEERIVRVPGLSRALDGYTIAQISDIHGGPLLDEDVLARGLALLKRARPDLIVATGDLVDDDARFAPRLARALADLQARDGVFAILGNHDYYAGAQRVVQAVSAAGVRMLVNDGVAVRPGEGGGFALLGVDDAWGPRAGGAGPDLEAALRAVPGDAPKVLLSHQPDTVERFAGRVALQLSGHTHGGQLNPGFVPARMVTPYVAGRYDVRGTTLYVNRGLGTTGLPSRIGAAPEITRIVLVSG